MKPDEFPQDLRAMAVEAACVVTGWRSTSDAEKAVYAALPVLLSAYRDRLAGEAGKNPYEDPPRPESGAEVLYVEHQAAAWSEGAAAMAADRDRWKAMAERLGEALQPICDRYPASAIPATMNAAGDAALRDLRAMTEQEARGA